MNPPPLSLPASEPRLTLVTPYAEVGLMNAGCCGMYRYREIRAGNKISAATVPRHIPAPSPHGLQNSGVL
ncbi:hypothetical protein J6590_025358 [Homalodisca vitripennis]|nr:hypothetical protein J6590_025358 [Homalodisca vitripennis]